MRLSSLAGKGFKKAFKNSAKPFIQRTFSTNPGGIRQRGTTANTSPNNSHPVVCSSAVEAVRCIKSNDTCYVHGAAATPIQLLEGLAQHSAERGLSRIELAHLHLEGRNACTASSTTSVSKNASDQKTAFFTNNFFIGSGERARVANGQGSLIPVFLGEIPKLITSGAYRPNVALLNVSPPDSHGYCSLGVEVCSARAAWEYADIRIAQINRHMPRTHGTSFVPYSSFDYVFECDQPLPQCHNSLPSSEDLAIGKYIASLIDDGACIQVGIGAIPSAVLEALRGHKDIGVHTEMFNDSLLPLLKSGVVTNTKKVIFPFRSVTSFIAGTDELYRYVNDNPAFLFLEATTTNDPRIIGRNPKVVAINSAVQVDITGQVCADSFGIRMLSGAGGQVDFERGAAISEGGVPIIAFHSSTPKGESKIVSCLELGAGVVTTRNHVHYVVTEYGVAQLWGKNLHQRAKALIDIAHPSHRARLEEEAFARYKIKAWA